ncbi:helix-turn-helix transcriptional regulator [Ectopseudomonas hydrolytica]|uniref:Helix-turn-helix domain protein n=1 Tax=Ectopseudomonas mendocina (strain ymp) TaxID=399739 RepID=A4XZG3_ECTM1
MNRIAAAREEAGIKQRDLIKKLGWTQARVSNYESGRRVPGLAESRAIVSALNALGSQCTLDDVFPPELDEALAAA